MMGFGKWQKRQKLSIDDAVRIDWPTENHDFRRTGFTLLKGDMNRASDIDKTSFVLEPGGIGVQEQVMKSIIADTDGNGAMEVVSLVHKTTLSNQTKIYVAEKKKGKKVKIGSATMLGIGQAGGATYFPGTLANIDADSNKELITGVRNGTIYAFDISGTNPGSPRWIYRLSPKYSPLAGENRINFNGGSAVVDVDLDGNNEVIFADVIESDREVDLL